MTDLNLTELRRLAEAATPGPWVYGEHNEYIGVYSDDDSGSIVATFHPHKYAPRNIDECRANAKLTAISREAILSLIERVERAEAERDEATNWTEIVEQNGTDKFDDLADKWVAMDPIQRVRNAVASVFVKWANEPLMARFREHMDNSMRLAFVEGALCGAKAATSDAEKRGYQRGLEDAAKVADQAEASAMLDYGSSLADVQKAVVDVAQAIRAMKGGA